MWHQMDQNYKGDCFLLIYPPSVFFHWLAKNMLINFFSNWLYYAKYVKGEQGVMRVLTGLRQDDPYMIEGYKL